MACDTSLRRFTNQLQLLYNFFFLRKMILKNESEQVLLKKIQKLKKIEERKQPKVPKAHSLRRTNRNI